MIELTIVVGGVRLTYRTAVLQPDGKRYLITDYPSGDMWFIKHAEQQGSNALARKMLKKPTAGITRFEKHNV